MAPDSPTPQPQPRSQPRSRRGLAPAGVPLAAALDAAVVTVFVSVGRRTHDGSNGFGDVFATGAPFLIALALGWAVCRSRLLRGGIGANPLSLRFGAAIWVCTLVVGMLLRRLVFDRGTALSFVIVATVFLAATLLGWRLVALLVSARRRRGQDFLDASGDRAHISVESKLSE